MAEGSICELYWIVRSTHAIQQTACSWSLWTPSVWYHLYILFCASLCEGEWTLPYTQCQVQLYTEWWKPVSKDIHTLALALCSTYIVPCHESFMRSLYSTQACYLVAGLVPISLFCLGNIAFWLGNTEGGCEPQGQVPPTQVIRP